MKQSDSTLRLRRLSIRNFKGLKRFDLDAGGESVTVYGDNATGKTTLLDAWSWLLWGRDSAGRADFAIKSLDVSGEPAHNIDHAVTAELELDGQAVTLAKTYREIWTRRRGSPHEEFTGHTTDHAVDGVVVKLAEFQARLDELGSSETLRLLTDPTYFSDGLHWQDRRRLLIEICGDVTADEVIAADSELADLPDLLGDRSPEQLRSVTTALRARLNRELEQLPTRIDEASRGLEDLPGDIEDAKAALEKFRKERAALSEQRQRIESGGQIAELKKLEAEADARIQTLLAEAEAERQQKRKPLEETERKLERDLDAARDQLARLRRDEEDAERRVASDLNLRDSLAAEWEEVRARTPPETGGDKCPSCDQVLPAEQVEAARQTALKAFNLAKSRDMARLEERGKVAAEAVQWNRDRLARLRSAIEPATAEIAELEEKLAAARAALEDYDQQQADPPEIMEWVRTRDDLANRIVRLRADSRAELEKADKELAAVDGQLAELEKVVARHHQAEKTRRRIAELEAEQKQVARDYELTERTLWLLDKFTRAKVAALDERVNSNFSLASFQLTRQLVNGGLEDCCETTYEGVPYRDLNHGAKIQIGLDIIRTLQRHYGLQMPVWVDQSESITELPEIGCQLIRLAVSAADRQLRVERRAK